MQSSVPVARRVHTLFEAGVFLKGLNAIFELAGGLAVLLIPPAAVRSVAVYFTAVELGEDPGDAIAKYLRQFAETYAAVPHHFFAAAYLLTHGVAKLVVVVGLLRDRAWAFPAGLTVFGLFALYQGYVLTHTFSVSLLALLVLDLVVLYLIVREWQSVRAGTNFGS